MAGRQKLQTFTVFTLDGSSKLGSLRMAATDVNIATQDGSPGTSATESATEVKRSSVHEFELLLQDSGVNFTADQISTALYGATSLLGVTRNGTFEVSIANQDGSGWGDFDTFPNATKRKISASLRQVVSIDAKHSDWKTWIRSSDNADRLKTLEVGLGDFVFESEMRLVGVKNSHNNAQLDEVDLKFERDGAFTGPTGSSIFGVAFAGDGLLSVVQTQEAFHESTGVSTGTGTETLLGLITQMTVGIEDGNIGSIRGTLALQTMALTTS